MCNVPEIPEGHKRCSTCHNTLPRTLEFFYRDSSRPDGFQYNCKMCTKQYDKNRPSSSKKRKKISSRVYYEENKSAILARNKEWRKRNSEQVKAYSKEHRTRRPVAHRRYTQKWRENNNNRYLETSRRWHREHKERDRENARKWKRKNKERVRALTNRYRARKLNAAGNHSQEDIKLIYKQQCGHCYWCQCELDSGYHIDHRIPLSKGGSNDASNLVASCPHCNQSKGDKLPHEWNGRLL